MFETFAQVLSAIHGSGKVPLDDVRRWIATNDLLTWGAVYRLTYTGFGRVEPLLPPFEHIELVKRYLLRCVEENPLHGEYLHGGYKAAWELAEQMKDWRAFGGSIAASLRGVAIELERIYRGGDDATQARVLCGVLEHAFEDPGVRRYFATWMRDPELSDAYRAALEWGTAHE